MNPDHAELLFCPKCHRNLRLEILKASGPLVDEGVLHCDDCDASYPIIGGIPRFVSAQEYTSSFGFQWSRHARTQLDSETGTPISRQRFFAVTGWPERMQGETILEVGGGAGRFTEVTGSTGATVISLDYSQAVEANYAANRHRDNVVVVQADLFRPPLGPESVDRVFCFGVLQHTPDPEAAFEAILTPLAPGGRVAVDVYAWKWWRYLLMTYYWVRPVTRRLPAHILYKLCRTYIRAMWGISSLINRLPKGRRLNQILLIADYRGQLDLPDQTLREWAILDTFDHLSPRFDKPQRLSTVRRWFENAGLVERDVRYGYNGIQARGRKPPIDS